MNESGDTQSQIRREHAIEIMATFILALATVATAWSGYQAARWGGYQSTLYSQASALRIESVRASSTAERLRQLDLVLFTNWVDAYATGDENRMEFYEQRFRPKFRQAFDAWMITDPINNPEAPFGPFVMPEYDLILSDKAMELEEEAVLTFEQGKDANQMSDNYIFNTVILASVLFLSGITSRFKFFSVRVAITIMAIVILVYGLMNILSYPVL